LRPKLSEGDWNPDKPDGFKMYPLAMELIRSSLAEFDKQTIRNSRTCAGFIVRCAFGVSCRSRLVRSRCRSRWDRPEWHCRS